MREKLNVKGQLNIAIENNNHLTNKYKEGQDEIKELKTKLKGNISLIKTKQIVWNDIIQEVSSIWECIYIISTKKIL